MPHSSRVPWLSWLVTFVVLYGVYLCFVATLAKPELYVGIGAAAISTIAVAVFGLIGVVKFRPTLKNLIEAWRIPYYLVEGTYEILKGLGQQLITRPGAASLVRAVRYSVGQKEDASDAARRALAEIYTTMTPNFIVFGVVYGQRLLLYHQILPGEVLRMTINLGAEP